MIVNKQIEKVFGQNNYEENIIKKPINKIKIEKKISNRKNKNNNIKEKNKSQSSNNEENIKVIPFIDKSNEKDNLFFYVELMKKIRNEEKKENDNYLKLTQKKKHKPGFLKKEKSESNFHKNFLNEKKDTNFFKRNNSLLLNEKEIQTPNNKNKNIDKKNIFENNDKRNSKTNIKKENDINHIKSQNLLSFENALNQNFKFNNKNIGFNIENEKIQHSIRFEIINNFKKFNVLKIQSKVNYNQIIKEVDFSNVKKINLNYKKEGNSNNSYVKITDNVNNNDEVRYQVPNNLLTQKKKIFFVVFKFSLL